MERLNCIIVDDEPLAQNLIEKFIKRVPYLTLQAKYNNAIAAMDDIPSANIIFLDVNMPEMSGIELLNCLNTKRPYIIMTTAHPGYALEGFELDVVDYLLKPISFGRFMKSLNKVKERIAANHEIEIRKTTLRSTYVEGYSENLSKSQEIPQNEEFFLIKSDKKLIKVNIDEIIYVEGMKDYVKIHLQKNYIITHITMTKIWELLPHSRFIRINRSFIVQISFIKFIEGNMIETSNGNKLTIGIKYREQIKETAKGWTI